MVRYYSCCVFPETFFQVAKQIQSVFKILDRPDKKSVNRKEFVEAVQKDRMIAWFFSENAASRAEFTRRFKEDADVVLDEEHNESPMISEEDVDAYARTLASEIVTQEIFRCIPRTHPRIPKRQ